MNLEQAKNEARELILEAFGKEGVINLMWVLETSDEYSINQNFVEDFDEEPNDSDWDEINDTITNFENQYRNIIGEYVNGSITECGHDSHDALIGGADATLKEVVKILETGESLSGGEVVFTSTSGNFDRKELELLHSTVDATLTFIFPEELVEAIYSLNTNEINALITQMSNK